MNKRSSLWVSGLSAAIAIWLIAGTVRLGLRSSDSELQRLGNIGTAVAAIAGFVGLLVLIVYTRETLLLWRTAEEENENRFKPVVTVDISTTDAELGKRLSFTSFTLNNIGSGPAFNVAAKPISGNGVEMRIQDVALLEVNKTAVLEFTIVQEGQPCPTQLEKALLRDHLERGTFPV